MIATRPFIGPRLLDSWTRGWQAAIDGASGYVEASLAGEVQPLDHLRWWNHMARRQVPEWATPHEIAFETPLARLRDFSTRRRGVLPTLVLPPQAGHDSCIVDYSPAQSQMGAILEAGLERALTLDWLGATPSTAGASIEDYLDIVDQAVEHCGGIVNLIGDCQGGWLATIYAALCPERVNTLTIAGAPIDFHAGEPVIAEIVRQLAPHGNLWFYEALVASGGGVFKGRYMLSGFIAINPEDEISRQLELLQSLADPHHVERYTEFEDWFKHTQDIPGAFYLWILRHLFVDNELIAGKLEIDGTPVELGRIGMPLNLLGGERDHITPPEQVFALKEASSTPVEQVSSSLSSGGHLGLFMGREALRERWPVLLADVRRRSTVGSAGRSRA
jgi:poly(3-hydroxyalkanoate) synthetase